MNIMPDTKHLSRFVTLMLIIIIASCSPEKQAEQPLKEQPKEISMTIGAASPIWTGTDLATGQDLSFPALLDDKPAVLIFWATWCPYCKAFMPYAGQIQADYEEYGVQIVTFNTKERGKGDPLAYVQSLGFPLVAVADADEIAASYGVEFIPGLMVVDGNGDFRYLRGWTDLPAGLSVAEQWDGEVRAALDAIVGR
jgi:thiol-disulfide isomerase/thioredoxin